MFDRVVVISLARRPERLDRFHASLEDWPFARPEVFHAIDGAEYPMPETWNHGPGAWGCLLSHVLVVDRAIKDEVDSLLVLEDDAVPIENFPARVDGFLAGVPGNWDGLMLGGQHLLPPDGISDGVVRCRATNRTHAFAIRRALMRELRRLWGNDVTDHCDVVLASTMGRYEVFAPDPFLIGQSAGFSDITGVDEPSRFFPVDRRGVAAHMKTIRQKAVDLAICEPALSQAAATELAANSSNR